MADFLAALNTKKASETEKPKPKPVGTYTAAVSGFAEGRKVNTKNGEANVLEFPIKMMAPYADVDDDALAAVGDIAQWPPMRKSFWPDTPEGEYALKQFLTQTLGIDEGDKTYGEMIAEAVNRPLLATLTHSPYTDKEGQPGIRTDIGSVAAV